MILDLHSGLVTLLTTDTNDQASKLGNRHATDPAEGGAQISMIKAVLKTDFANISAAVTADATDLNRTDVTTEGTAAAGEVLTATTGGAIDGTALTWSNLGSVTTCDINGGTIDGVTISGSTITASGNTLTIASTDLSDTAALTYNADTDVSGNGWVLDEDTLASDSATKVPTQQSVKAYVDTQVAAVDSVYTMTHEIADLSTSETVYVPVPVSGTVTRVDVCQQAAINTADATVTLVTSADAAMASLVIAESGSAAGVIDTDTSISNAAVTAGSYLKLSTNGNSTGSAKALVTITVQTDTV